MLTDSSIAISAKDNFTQAITTMRNANSSFNKDLTGTLEKLNELNRNKITLKVDTDRAKSELKAAEKQFLATGSAADKMAMEIASEKYENARRNLDLVSKNARQAERDILNMTDAVSKADNRAGTGKSTGIAGAVSAIAQAGLTKMVGDTVSVMANTLVSSAYGSNTGTLFESALSGAGSGAAIGSMISPGVGTAIGAAAGTAIGAVNGAVQNFQKEDDAFKSVVQESYNTIKQSQSELLASGINIAAKREQDMGSFTTILGGSEKAKSFLSSIRDFGNKTPFEYDQLTELSKTMLNYGYKQNEIIPLLVKVGDTASATKMSTEDIKYVITALGRMKMTGKTTIEYLNMLLDRHIPAFDYLAEASGKTKGQIVEMVSKGLIPGEQAAKTIADYMGKANEGSMELQSHTYNGLKSSLEDAQDDLTAALGQGYIDESKKGIQAQIDWLGGKTGSALKEAYSMQGKFQASLENMQKDLEQRALTGVVSGEITGNFSEENKSRLKQLAEDYKKSMMEAAKGNEQAEIQAAQDVEEAKIIAANEYKATRGYQLQLEADKSLIASIREDTGLKSEYWNAGYTMQQEFTKGLGYKAKDKIVGMLGISNAIKSPGYSGMVGGTGSAHSSGYVGMVGSSHATGLFRVPYNNFPALLHEGEMVSTAVEARSAKKNPSVVISGNSFVVREEADVDKIARALVEKIQKAEMIT
ncbi:tape measure protein [Caproiciproducens galactitolivorans]|uniref:tape measure protein n=1 Tax=Caproiciproducens galactitolivorans TaxID=642589 RepID=UPI00240A7F64|nr:tape measure protein [Caproiciproducens galactitolivorans]